MVNGINGFDRCILKRDLMKSPFCKNCDFLYEDNEVLVWKNNDLVQINKMKGTKFNLGDYQHET